ncbi:acetoacetate decarboxylase family protein [Pleurocapsales cyanobacterium LEGE 06147]|nr:acetoacetate decarboxylase family protein [Pleurocapsales cyanobacterium LEGE 06147]
MTYPSAPWHLQGYALSTLHLIDIKSSRSLIPPELEIVSILPGKTVGGVYVSVYKSGSILEYNELIVAAALVRYQNKIGSWISHIYVDNEESVVGGREIWGLPKEMAQFAWEDNRVSVRQADRLLCRLDYQPSWLNLSTWWQPKLNGNCFSGLGSELLSFTSQFSSEISLLSGSLTVPNNSPFANLNLGQPWLTLNLKKLNLIVEAPKKVGKKSVIELVEK